jgi:acetolactate synthase small subunit
MSRHIVTCRVRSNPLIFVRVAGVCAHRRYDVDSIIARPAETPGVSLITLLIEADQHLIANAVKQLDKLVDVLRVELRSPASAAECDLLLARVGSAVDELASDYVQSESKTTQYDEYSSRTLTPLFSGTFTESGRMPRR